MPKLPHIEFIMEVTDIETEFVIKLKELCTKYGRDYEEELYKAFLVLTDDIAINIVRNK
jgi:hypothetical protein